MVLFIFIMYIYLKRLHQNCIPEQGIKSVNLKMIQHYLSQYIPINLAQFSDYLRVAVIGYFCTTLGEIQLSLLNTCFKLILINLAFVTSVGAAIGIKISQHLGAGATEQSKSLLFIGISSITVYLTFIGMVIVTIPSQIGSVFSSDPEYLHLFITLKYPIAMMLVFQNFTVACELILTSMGRGKLMFKLAFVSSWMV